MRIVSLCFAMLSGQNQAIKPSLLALLDAIQ
jgi:hypothetical protein